MNIYTSASLCLQEIYKDRKKFSKAVFEVASSDLVNMGISVVSYTLKDIRDEEVCTSFNCLFHVTCLHINADSAFDVLSQVP